MITFIRFFWLILAFLTITSCHNGSRREIPPCDNSGYLIDLDGTFVAYVTKDTHVEWPTTPGYPPEDRHDEGNFRLIGDQCGDAIVFFGAVGNMRPDGAELHIDIENVDFNGFKYVVTGYGWISPNGGYVEVYSDYEWVTYDSTWIIGPLELVFN